MEKDIGKIPKNPDTDIIIRIDDFGGRVGLTIREFVKSERYTGFTKAGTRVPAEYIKQFKDAINSIDESEIDALAIAASATARNSGGFEKKQSKLGGSSGKNSGDKKEDSAENVEEEAM